MTSTKNFFSLSLPMRGLLDREWFRIIVKGSPRKRGPMVTEESIKEGNPENQ